MSNEITRYRTVPPSGALQRYPHARVSGLVKRVFDLYRLSDRAEQNKTYCRIDKFGRALCRIAAMS